MMTMDNLPAQLPREATDYFGLRVLPFLLHLVSSLKLIIFLHTFLIIMVEIVFTHNFTTSLVYIYCVLIMILLFVIYKSLVKIGRK